MIVLYMLPCVVVSLGFYSLHSMSKLRVRIIIFVNQHFSAPHVKTSKDPEVITLKYLEDAKSLFAGLSFLYLVHIFANPSQDI